MGEQCASDSTVGALAALVSCTTLLWIISSIVAVYYRKKCIQIESDPRNSIVTKPTRKIASVAPKPNQDRTSSSENRKIDGQKVSSQLGSSLSNPNRKKNDWEISFKEIKLQNAIGSGNFGEVYKGMWCGTYVAVKIPRSNIPQNMMDKFMDEVGLMTTLHHPNIVIFMAACIVAPNICLVLEYLEKGNMYDFLRNQNESLNMNTLHRFAMDIARGMKYLHRRAGIIQRDLKSKNLLIDDSNNVKICDFGLSRYNETDETMTHCGTPYWTAPEVIRQESYNEKADVYSFSIVLWELITRDEPYDGMPGMEVAFAAAERGLRPKIPRFCPDEYKTMMEECWDGDPEKRPGFDEILDRLFQIKKQRDRTQKRFKMNRSKSESRLARLSTTESTDEA